MFNNVCLCFVLLEVQWHSVEPQLAVTLEMNKVLLWSSNCTVVVINNEMMLPPLTAALHFAIIESRIGNSVVDQDQEGTDSIDNSTANSCE